MAATPVPTGRTDTPRRDLTGSRGGSPLRPRLLSRRREFYAYVVTFAMILIAEHRSPRRTTSTLFRADKVWLYITILTVGYMVSRGLARRQQ